MEGDRKQIWNCCVCVTFAGKQRCIKDVEETGGGSTDFKYVLFVHF